MSGCETALTSINFYLLRRLKRLKHKYLSKTLQHKNKKIVTFVKNYNLVLVTILIGNTVCTTTVATCSSYLFATVITNKSLSIWIALISSTLFILVLCEIGPKIIAKHNPEQFLITCFILLTAFVWLFMPLAKIITIGFKNSGVQLLGENELLEIVSHQQKIGILEKEEEVLISAAIRFDETTLQKVTTKLVNTVYLSPGASLQDYQAAIKNRFYSRIPVYDHNQRDFIGFIHVKDVFNCLADNHQVFTIPAIIRPIIKLNSNNTLNQVLLTLQMTRNHIAAVYCAQTKKLMGIATMENVLEEIVGEIYDERESFKQVQEVGKNAFIVAGDTKIKTLFLKYLKIGYDQQDSLATLSQWFNQQPAWKKSTSSYFFPEKVVLYQNFLFRLNHSQQPGPIKKRKTPCFHISYQGESQIF